MLFLLLLFPLGFSAFRRGKEILCKSSPFLAINIFCSAALAPLGALAKL